MGFSGTSTSSKTKANATSLQRIEACRNQPENQICADCSEDSPTWASLITPPFGSGKGKKVAVFCCYKCCSYHFQLGREICEVKNIKTASDWSEDEIKALEASHNGMANDIYEGLLDNDSKPSPGDQEAQAEFVQAKYKDLRFFCKKAYQEANGSWFATANYDRDTTIGTRKSSTQTSRPRRSFLVAKDVPKSESDNLSETEEESDVSQSRYVSDASVHSPNAAEEEDLGYSNQQQQAQTLGYDEIDLGYGISVEEQNCRQVDQDLASELARRAIDGGGRIRRGSLGRRASMGTRRESMGQRRGSAVGTVGTMRRESMGQGRVSISQRRGSMGRPGSIEKNSRRGRRSSMGAGVEDGASGHIPRRGLRKNVSSHQRRRASTCSSGVGDTFDLAVDTTSRVSSVHHHHSNHETSPVNRRQRGIHRPVPIRRSGSNSSVGSIYSHQSSSYDSDESFDD